MALYNNSIFCDKVEKIPKESHYAIIEFTSIRTPGFYPNDPPSSEPVQKYIAFLKREDWEAEIRDRTIRKSPDKFVAVFAMPAQIEVNVMVNAKITPD